MNWTMPYPWRSRTDSVRRINMSREPGNESFFCALRPIPRILSLRRCDDGVKFSVCNRSRGSAVGMEPAFGASRLPRLYESSFRAARLTRGPGMYRFSHVGGQRLISLSVCFRDHLKDREKLPEGRVAR